MEGDGAETRGGDAVGHSFLVTYFVIQSHLEAKVYLRGLLLSCRRFLIILQSIHFTTHKPRPLSGG